jgi:carboxymethylenebutenolidase
MWNQFNTDTYQGMISETIPMIGHNGDTINAYFARPLGPGPFPGIVLIHHLPGWDEFYRETARRFANHGYIVLCPNLYSRFGHGLPDDVTATARAAGGASDESVLGDCEAAMKYIKALAYSNNKVGIIGTCSGGRHSYLAACKISGLNAIVNCWGGRVIMATEDLNPNQPVSPIDYTKDLNIPILGIFGNEDQNPTPEQVNQLEEELKKHGKDYEFHRYDDAGHGFWYYDRQNYRPQQAMDSWEKVLSFFGKHLG